MSFAIVGFVITYSLLLIIALWLVPKVVHHKYIKRIIFIVWFLIPTWDVIIGYPIYWYLCKYESGMKIYKTVDNVEGFYVGEQSKKFEPREPYEGYKFVEYKEKESGKYYRSYWIDNNTSELCVPIGDDKWTHNSELYSKHFKSGKCIVKEEIDENEVSRWEYSFNKELIYEIPIFKFEVSRELQYLDKKTKEVMAISNGIWWQGGWLYGIFSSIEVGSGGTSCNGDLDYTKLKKEVLKPKKGN